MTSIFHKITTYFFVLALLPSITMAEGFAPLRLNNLESFVGRTQKKMPSLPTISDQPKKTALDFGIKIGDEAVAKPKEETAKKTVQKKKTYKVVKRKAKPVKKQPSVNVYRKYYDKENQHLPIARYKQDYVTLYNDAILRQDYNAAQALKKALGKTKITNDNGNSPLILAILAGKPQAVETILNSSKIKIDEQNAAGYTALHIAINSGNSKIVEQLLLAGANANKTYGKNISPLLLATIKGNANIAHMLIRAGADVHYKAQNNNSLLHIAAIYEKPQVFKLLVDKGIDINILNDYSQTPLMQAVGVGQVRVADILLAMGANYQLRDAFGQLPFEVAKGHNNIKMANLIARWHRIHNN